MNAAPAPAPVSRGAAWKIVATVLVVTGAVTFLLTASMKPNAEYYKHVYEVMGKPDAWRGKHLKVEGRVVDGSIEQAKGTLQYRFKIQSGPKEPPAIMDVSYTGLVPDTFKSGAQVVATGMLTADNKLDVVPDGIMAKCPSKYEADKAAGTGQKPDPGVAQKL